jgi:hypothetical protein
MQFLIMVSALAQILSASTQFNRMIKALTVYQPADGHINLSTGETFSLFGANRRIWTTL